MSLLEKLTKAGSIKHASTLDESTFFSTKDLIQTKFPIINVAMSGALDGGLVPGLTVLAGPSKHFKSNLGLIMVQAYMKQYEDAVCLFYDSEFGITPEYIAANGIDTARVIHIPIEHIEQLKFDIVKRLDSIERKDKVIIFIDSIGNLASKKEAEDALEEKSAADMTRAKQLKSLFRIITPHLTTKDLPCIAINHVYQTQEMFSKAVVSGGCLAKGTKLQMEDNSLKNIEDIKVGDRVKTLNVSNEVTHIWDPETLIDGTPECFKIVFDDGYRVVCSENHPFLTTIGWVQAKNLTGNEDIVCV